MASVPNERIWDGTRSELGLANQVDLLCDKFEHALQSGKHPLIEDYLDAVPEQYREALLEELLKIEFYWRHKQSGLPPVEVYLMRFPAHSALVRHLWNESERDDPTVRVATHRFRLFKQLPRGGGGIVYRAWDASLGREVALKELRHDVSSDPKAWQRFENEARITALLEHRGVPPVYAAASSGASRPYFVTRLVRGENLGIVIKRFHRDHRESTRSEWLVGLRPLLRQFLEVCAVIDHAHARGVIHRDLKPANVLLGAYGETFVIDWGIALVLENHDEPGAVNQPSDKAGPLPHPNLTLAGELLGTPGYASPEQHDPLIGPIGAATDVYGLGALLYHILTGKRPFGDVVGYSAELTPESLARLAEAVTTGELRSPRTVRPQIPRALDAICRRAMRPVPRDRYASASDLARDVANWLDGASVSVSPDRWWVRLRRWCGRHRLTTGAAAATIAITALVGGVLFLDGLQAQARVSSLVNALGTASIDQLPHVANQLKQDRGRALQALDRALSTPVPNDNNEELSTNLQLVALALDPGRTTALSHRLRTDREFAASLVVRLAKLGNADPAQYKSLLELLHPLRDALTPHLLEVSRRLLVTSDALDEHDRARVAEVLLDFARHRPALLAEASLHVPDQSYLKYVERLRDSRDETLTELERLEAKIRPGWSNEREIEALPAPVTDVVAEIVATRGVVTPLFAFSPRLDAQRLVPLVEALRPSGYRPIRVRPVADDTGNHLSVVWTRDEIGWELLLTESPAEIVARDDENRRRDWQAVEASSHERASPGGERRTHFIGIWAERVDRWKRIASGSARNVANFKWSSWPIISIDADYATRIGVDMTPEATAAFAASLDRSVWQLRTCQVFLGRDGTIRRNETWDNLGRWGPVKTLADAQENAFDDLLTPHFFAEVPTDLSLRRVDGALRFTSTAFYPQPFFDFHTEKHTPLDELPARAAALSAAGFKPLCLAVAREKAGLRATSLWHIPSYPKTTVSDWEMRLFARPIVTRFHLGNQDALWEALRASADPNVRAFLIEHMATLGVPIEALLNQFLNDEDPSLRASILQALRTYPRSFLDRALEIRFFAAVETLSKTTPDDALRRYASWALNEWGLRQSTPGQRTPRAN